MTDCPAPASWGGGRSAQSSADTLEDQLQLERRERVARSMLPFRESCGAGLVDRPRRDSPPPICARRLAASPARICERRLYLAESLFAYAMLFTPHLLNVVEVHLWVFRFHEIVVITPLVAV